MARLVIMLLVVVAASSAAAARDRFRKLNDEPIREDSQATCEKPAQFVPLPNIKSEQFCSSAHLDTNPTKCVVLDLVEATLVRASGEHPMKCNEDNQPQTPAKDTSVTGIPLPFPLSDQRPLPASLPSSLLSSEGASYYFIWKNLYNFAQWAPCASTNTPQRVTPGTPVTGDPKHDWLVPAGWTVHSTLWEEDGSEAFGLYWPFATVAYKGADAMILIRGSQTQQDWISDFNYNTSSASLASGTYALQLPGQVHQGFAAVAASLWPGIQSALQSLNPGGQASAIKNVYVAGHSLGAGVATLVAYGVQEYINSQLVGNDAKVAALLFAPPNAGDLAFASQFDKSVNARRIPFLHDMIPQVPCSPTMVGCKRASVPTGTQLWHYSSVGGTLVLEPRAMPQQPLAWSHLSKVYPCQMKRFLQATHICSYNCYLSQFAADEMSMCKLWGDNGESGVPGTFCNGFPTTEGPKYPYIL